MLAIIGTLMLLLFFLDNATHLSTGFSLTHLLLFLASVSFVGEFIRSRVSARCEYWRKQQAEAPRRARESFDGLFLGVVHSNWRREP